MMIRVDLGGNDSPSRCNPPDHDVGWKYVADNGPYVAIGPRLFASVAHVGVSDKISYQGQEYNRHQVLEFGHDTRFITVDRDLPNWADPFLGTDFDGGGVGKVFERETFMVGGGYGYGYQFDNTYQWGGVETQRKRWAASSKVQWYGGTFLTDFLEGAAATQDSGYGVFLNVDGKLKYLGALIGQKNPAVVGTISNIGIAGPWLYRQELAEYLKNPPVVTPPVPPSVSSPRLEFAVDVSAPPGGDTVLEASDDHGKTWTPVAGGFGTFTYREPATGKARLFRARSVAS